jgi:hypothetical protein
MKALIICSALVTLSACASPPTAGDVLLIGAVANVALHRGGL